MASVIPATLFPAAGLPASAQPKVNQMRKLVLAALGAATMAFAVPAAAQDIPLTSGNFWSVTEVTIDDGQFATYADYLADTYRKNMEFQKSKGWITDWYI